MDEQSTAVIVKPLCGAKKRGSGEPGEFCQNISGYKTEHVGSGRCYYHGGATGSGRPVLHGKYSKKLSLYDKIQEIKEDPQLLNADEPVALLRALLNEQIFKHDEASSQYTEALEKWLDDNEGNIEDFPDPPEPDQFVNPELIRLVVQAQKVAHDMRYQRRATMPIPQVGQMILSISEKAVDIMRRHRLPPEAEKELADHIRGLSIKVMSGSS